MDPLKEVRQAPHVRGEADGGEEVWPKGHSLGRSDLGGSKTKSSTGYESKPRLAPSEHPNPTTKID